MPMNSASTQHSGIGSARIAMQRSQYAGASRAAARSVSRSEGTRPHIAIPQPVPDGRGRNSAPGCGRHRARTTAPPRRGPLDRLFWASPGPAWALGRAALPTRARQGPGTHGLPW